MSELPIDPPIPERQEAMSRVRMGEVAKVVLEFRDRFWEELPGLKKMAFVFAPEDEFHTIWVPPAQAPLLTVWAGGPRATRLCKLGDDEVIARAIDSLSSALGVAPESVRQKLVRAHFHNWTRDEFSRGAYTYVGVGGADSHAVLARPVGDALFFAGEATMGGGFNATMEGATRSGTRAADELLAAHAGALPARK
jgi:monoamine oxidase